VRSQLAEGIFAHFLDNGFDKTTVEQAARAVGISRATFFRYFRSKEDAVIVAMDSSELDFGSALKSIEFPHGEAEYSQLRLAFAPVVEATEADQARLHARARMITSTPSLRAHLCERRKAQEERLVAALNGRVTDPLTARVVVTVALSAFDLAWRVWASGPSGSFRHVLDSVFDRLPAPVPVSLSPSTDESSGEVVSHA
jgi:AcrR family transcriptional regulator